MPMPVAKEAENRSLETVVATKVITRERKEKVVTWARVGQVPT